MKNSKFAYLNGRFVNLDSAQVSIFDSSYLYGEGVFETLRVYNGKPAFADRHYSRLRRNAEILGLSIAITSDSWPTILEELLIRNSTKDAAIRATFSRENISIFCKPVDINPALYSKGASLLLVDDLHNDSGTIAGIKSTNYLTQRLARACAERAGACEALLRNGQGHWVEGSKTNFFIIRNEKIITPPLDEGLLPGITREVLLEILKEKKILFEEKIILDIDLQQASEIFLTGTLTEVMSVSTLSGRIDRTLPVGPTSKKLLRAYRSRINS